MDLSLFLLLLAGLAAGTVSGLLGVGGGIVLTPFLHYGLGHSWTDAVVLSLWVIALQAPLGVLRHAQKGAVDWRLAASLAVGGMGGVYLGDLLVPRLGVPVLKLLFAVLLGAAAWRMSRPSAPHAERPVHPALAVGLGLGAGIISRLLGVGGGILTVPVLSLLGLPVHLAVGTSLVPVFTNAALASGANLARGLDPLAGIALAAGALPGSLLGVRLAHRLPEVRLRRVVAVAMVLAALSVAADALRA